MDAPRLVVLERYHLSRFWRSLSERSPIRGSKFLRRLIFTCAVDPGICVPFSGWANPCDKLGRCFPIISCLRRMPRQDVVDGRNKKLYSRSRIAITCLRLELLCA